VDISIEVQKEKMKLLKPKDDIEVRLIFT